MYMYIYMYVLCVCSARALFSFSSSQSKPALPTRLWHDALRSDGVPVWISGAMAEGVQCLLLWSVLGSKW